MTTDHRAKPKKAGNRVLVGSLPGVGQKFQLHGAEAHHLARVLRKQPGDAIEVIDGKGRGGLCKVIQVSRPELGPEGAVEVELELESLISASEKPTSFRLVLYLGILKGEAMEWVVEKAVELGVDALFPLMLDHSIVKVDGKGPEVFRLRWQRLADQALKQCGRQRALEVGAPTQLQKVKKSFSTKASYFFDEASDASTPHFFSEALSLSALPEGAPTEIHLLIGPEGGWSARERQELQSLTRRVHLGRERILRAETAALQAIAISTSIRDRGSESIS